MTGDQSAFRVELAEWTQRSPTKTRREVRRGSLFGLALGGFMVALVVALVVVVALGLVDAGWTEAVGVAFLSAVGGPVVLELLGTAALGAA